MTRSHRSEPRLNYAKSSFCALVMAAVASIAFGQSAVSQQTSTTAPTGTEIAPRGQREVKDLTYSDWKKLCFKPGGAKMICRTSISGTFPTGQMAVRVDIIEREGDATARLQVFCPVGMYLPKPATLTIDQGKPHDVPYTWCLTNACIAGAAADPKMVQEMSSGQMLRLEFVDSGLLSVSTSLPLGQFASIHKGAPAQTFEQDIDE
ncbi:invasion associated locus B family protein [Bradyrhizobium sp. JYMT SZCCT0428]|uniref:invasion associated locus B family protein n=1 Tax=Bradyrhizobium sp. JYMT SZCCT0428 TaxID=2807673 RepID=UPI001BAB3E58|nr:invasion associated locus B family protein [Bradyrhizobium sp. JYMT SZCCT0428]MBR1149295.1 invasion associated locus B family protein [Bradyrhizobium sp. JYMT SZCCT0428]